jgi:CheY-like chemotaxis protein
MNTNKTTILIIDDDRNFRKILSIRLKNGFPSCRIIEMEDLESASAFLENNNNIDLIILDQHLPDGTGTEFLENRIPRSIPVLSMSSDEAPEIPAATLLKGARFFLTKKNVSEPFFIPLAASLVDRSAIERKMNEAARSAEILESVRTLLRTLQHEINNPLGALFGGMYVLQSDKNLSNDSKEALELANESARRIKKVLDALSETAELEAVHKATETVYHIPGDPDWSKK